MYSPHTGIPQVRLIPHGPQNNDPQQPKSPTTPFHPDFAIGENDNLTTSNAFSIVSLSLSPNFYTPQQLSESEWCEMYQPLLNFGQTPKRNNNQVPAQYENTNNNSSTTNHGLDSYEELPIVKSFEYSPLAQLLHNVFNFSYTTIQYVLHHHINILSDAVQTTTDGIYITLDPYPLLPATLSTSLSSGSLLMYKQLNDHNNDNQQQQHISSSIHHDDQQFINIQNDMVFIFILLVAYYQEIVKLLDMNIDKNVVLHSVLYTNVTYLDDTIQADIAACCMTNQDNVSGNIQVYTINNVKYGSTTVDYQYLNYKTNVSNKDKDNKNNTKSLQNQSSILPPRTNLQVYVLPLYQSLISPSLNNDDHHHSFDINTSHIRSIWSILRHIQSYIFINEYDHYEFIEKVNNNNNNQDNGLSFENPIFDEIYNKISTLRGKIPINLIGQQITNNNKIIKGFNDDDDINQPSTNKNTKSTNNIIINQMMNRFENNGKNDNNTIITTNSMYSSITLPLDIAYETVYTIAQQQKEEEKEEKEEEQQQQQNLSINSSSSYTSPIYDATCLGGTFDHIHTGHFLLLFAATLMSSQQLIIGITAAELLVKKTLHQFIEPWYKRVFNVINIIQLINHSIPKNEIIQKNKNNNNSIIIKELYYNFITTIIPYSTTSQQQTVQRHYTALSLYNQKQYSITIEPLFDMYGPSVTFSEIKCLIVSEEVKKGGIMVNTKRIENNMNPSKLFVVPLLILPTAYQQMMMVTNNNSSSNNNNDVDIITTIDQVNPDNNNNNNNSDLFSSTKYIPTNNSLYKVSSTDFRQFHSFIATKSP